MTNSWVGYTGGDNPSPSYESVCARSNTHTEALKLEFDPDVLSFEELLGKFVEDPRIRGFGQSPPAAYAPVQTKKAVWAQNEAQAQAARRILADAGLPVPVVPPGCEFYEAEEYHQHHIAEDKSYPDGGDDDPWSATDGPGTAWGL